MLGYKAGDELGALRSLQEIHAVITRLLKAATKLQPAPYPSAFDLLQAINELELKDTELNKLNEMIGELVEAYKFEYNYYNVLQYQERIAGRSVGCD